ASESLAHRVLPPFPTRRSSDLEACSSCVGSHEAGALAEAPSLVEGRPTRNPHAALAYCERMTPRADVQLVREALEDALPPSLARSEEHTSELQSRENLVCRLLL